MIWHQISLPVGFGRPATLYIPGPDDECPIGAGMHSYDSERALLCWSSGLFFAHACDVEYLYRSSGLHSVLQERFGTSNQEEFLRRWVVTEVLAKLHDVPVVIWAGEHGLSLYLELDKAYQVEGAQIFLTQRCNRAMAFGVAK